MNALQIDTNFVPPPDSYYDAFEYFRFCLIAPKTEDDGNQLDEEWEILEETERPLELCNGDHTKTSELTRFLNQTIVKALQLINLELSSLRYIGPLRDIPESLDKLDETSGSDWFTGATAWLRAGDYHRLDDFHMENYSKTETTYEEQKQLKAYIESLDLMPYKLVETGKIDTTIPYSIHQQGGEKFSNYLKKLAIKRTHILVNKKSLINVTPRSIGAGISQVFPIVASTVLSDSNLCAYEQPELHLHPAMQCDLADVFIDGTKFHPDRISILETHSEHIILRLLRRMRETAAGKAPEGKELTPDDVAVLAFEAGEKGTEVHEMEISKAGELLTPWPNGFFPERMNEILGE